MRKYFVDANVIIDWLNADSDKHEECCQVLEIIGCLYHKPMVSSTTIAIVYYFVSKRIKDKKKLKQLMEKVFEPFAISEENKFVIKACFKSKMLDVEDAIQYYSALYSRADGIITYNLKDYTEKGIPVLHPQEFNQLHTFS